MGRTRSTLVCGAVGLWGGRPGVEAARIAVARREAWSASGSSMSERSGVRGIEIILLLVVLATAVAASARWLRVPAPSLLVVAGLLVAFVPGVPPGEIAPDVVSLVVLPP